MGAQLSCTLCEYNRLKDTAKFCPGCGTRQPLLGSAGKTLGKCHVCKVKQALDSKECTHCGTEDPVRYIEHFTDIKYYLVVSLALFLFSPVFGLFTGIFSIMYCIFYPRKEVVAKPSKKKIHHTEVASTTSQRVESTSGKNSEENLCQICFALPRNTILIPCGHVGLCDTCGKKLFKVRKPPCPFCTQPVEKMTKMYLV